MIPSSDYCRNCKKCTPLVTDSSQGTILCTVCGLIVEDTLIDPSKEFTPDKIRNDFRKDGGVSLFITGKKSGKSETMSTRLGCDSDERSLHRGLELVKQWGSLFSLQQKILNKALEQYSKVTKGMKTLKGYSLESIAAAVIYITSRICALPLEPLTIENTTGVALKDLKRAYKAVKKYADHIPPLEPKNYCVNFCKRLDLPSELSSAAEKITEGIKEKRLLDGKNPRTIASVAIYIVIQLTPESKHLLKELPSCSKIAESTIKNAFKEVYFYKYKIVPEWKGRAPLDSLQI